ncbi:MAG: hypothetical protein HOP10_02950 [Chitinophagaceae bacterium]|nr:hypothetical protein [Chitinophagaceae bacterium]
MHLNIVPNRFISEIQQEFNREFPFLKLEFFNKRSLSNADYSAAQMVPSSRKIGDIQKVVTDGNITIQGEMKVNELERILKDKFSLAAQVFRRSGNLWLETTMTDNWTLDQQNNHGKEISTGIIKNTEAEDFDLSRDADH